MTRAIAILRPQPGNAATAQAVRALGLEAVELPLFAVQPLPWSPPPAGDFDALLLTSANAVRHGGPGLRSLRPLPVIAVGAATAEAARDAGFDVAHIGTRGVAALLDAASGCNRLLWLAGRERTVIDHPALAETIAVYAANPCPLTPAAAPALAGGVAMVHSARAARQLCDEFDRLGIARAALRVAAISAPVATALGHGWGQIAIADAPNDTALIATARALAIDP